MDSILGICVSIELILLLLSPVEELDSNLLEESEGEKVLGLLLIGSNSCSERVDLGSDLISGSVIDNRVITDYLLSDLFAYGSGSSAVFTANKRLELLGNSCISAFVSKDYVVNSLRIVFPSLSLSRLLSSSSTGESTRSITLTVMLMPKRVFTQFNLK